MPYLSIDGPTRLSGTLSIQGSKNTVLPVMAASLLAEGRVSLYNCPDIRDVRQMLGIFGEMGVECSFKDGRVTIYANKPEGVVNKEACGSFRASSLLMGALIASTGYFAMPYPGGCSIGRRPIDFHIEGLRRLGVTIEEKNGLLVGYCKKLVGAEYTFSYPSVGALENLLIAAAKAEGMSVFRNCAKEPEIVDLCDFLSMMGAKIVGAGTDTICVYGVGRLRGCQYYVPGDRIVAGTYILACGTAGGNVRLQNIEPHRLETEIKIIRKTGCHLFTDIKKNEIIIISDGRRRAVPYVCAGPYPEFSTDLQPQMMAFLAFSAGTGIVSDSVFENRLGTAKGLQKMGATVAFGEKHVAITGGPFLKGCDVRADDLRQGAAFVIAGCAAYGRTNIYGCEYIERGYEDIAGDMKQLGANIKWQEEKVKTE